MTGLDVEQKISEQLAGRGDGNEEYRAEVSHRPFVIGSEGKNQKEFISFSVIRSFLLVIILRLQ